MSRVVDWVVEKVEDIKDTIGSFFYGIGGGISTPSSCTTSDHSKKIADELAEEKEKFRVKSEELETKVIDNLSLSMTRFLSQIEKINNQDFGGRSLNLNIEEIKRQNENLKKEVVGTFSDYLDNRFVLTDSELSVILKETNDKKREKEFKKFQKNVLAQAVDKLTEKLETTIKKQEMMIRDKIQGRLDEVEKKMGLEMKDYNDILNAKSLEEKDMGVEQIKNIYKYELAHILSLQLEGGRQ